MPTWGARLHVASHVVGVVFEGHNDVGDRWVHGPSSIEILCPTQRFFYSLFSVSKPPQPGIRLNIRWTRLLLAAICAALILPTFFFLLLLHEDGGSHSRGNEKWENTPLLLLSASFSSSWTTLHDDDDLSDEGHPLGLL